MSDFPTFGDLFRVARDEILSRNTKLTREVVERNGSDANILAAAGSAVGDEVVGALACVESGLYLDSATGKQLDRLIFDRFNLPRKNAAPAVGSVEFSTQASAPAGFSITKGTKLGTADGKQFITTAEASYPFGSLGPISVAVRSTQAGAAQQAAVGTITSILGAIVGAPSDLSVTNSKATSGADDAESDDDYRERGRRVFSSARRGTLDAIETAALGVLGVKTAAAFEFLDSFGRPAKATQLIISDAFTEGLLEQAVVPPAYQAQSQVLADQVFANLVDARPAGIFVDVLVASVVIQSVQLGLSFTAGVAVDSVALEARAAIVNLMNSLSPGETLTVAAMISALRRVVGLAVSGDEILSPAGDVTARPIEVLRTSLAQVVASTVQPDRALQGSANPDGVS